MVLKGSLWRRCGCSITGTMATPFGTTYLLGRSEPPAARQVVEHDVLFEAPAQLSKTTCKPCPRTCHRWCFWLAFSWT